MERRTWDQMYGTRGRLISDQPNATLVSETRHLAPGRALDVGCGYGADARWLADHGWDVTAIDLSGVALTQARAKTAPTARVTWLQGDLLSSDLRQSFDLVSALYLPLPRSEDHAILRCLLKAVATGGTLLVINHDLPDLDPTTQRAAADHYLTPDILTALDAQWTIDVHERRPRSNAAPHGTNHTHDIVLRATRHQ
jgi:SAM-dependent methyltransferase